MPRPRKVVHETRVAATSSRDYDDESLLQRLQSQFKLDQSYLSLALGLLIVLVAGILVYNYFQTNQQNLGPAQQTANETVSTGDVEPGDLPGKYTVKEGDTLFLISEKYYSDGYKYQSIANANSLTDVNTLEVGQVLDIPKVEEAPAAVSTNPIVADKEPVQTGNGTGGAENQTIWGEKITGDTYTVQADDWLSKIAGRAYGDIYAFDKIAKANNITDPNVIEPGTVLNIPR